MYPTPEEAKKIIATGDYKRIPVTMELNSDMVTPVMAVKRLKKVSHHCFMLESAEADKKWGRYTFLGFDPTLELTCQDGVLKIKSGFEITEEVTHPMEYIRKIIKDNKSPVLEGLPPFAGGLVGYFSYDYIKYSEPSLKLSAKDEESFKDVDLMLFDKIICFDNYRQKIILIVNVRTENFDTSYNKGVMELEKELLKDEKELAEHNMLVDLGRNDIGRISRIGSVEVERYMEIQRYSHVMHIGSTVRGIIRDDMDALNAVDSILPAGTLSGAPKLKACELICELENNKRGIYGGAIGYIDFTGNLDTCIAIRLAFAKNGKVFVRSGAGIVADSVPENEFEECINKAKAVMNALKEAEGGIDNDITCR